MEAPRYVSPSQAIYQRYPTFTGLPQAHGQYPLPFAYPEAGTTMHNPVFGPDPNLGNSGPTRFEVPQLNASTLPLRGDNPRRKDFYMPMPMTSASATP